MSEIPSCAASWVAWSSSAQGVSGVAYIKSVALEIRSALFRQPSAAAARSSRGQSFGAQLTVADTPRAHMHRLGGQWIQSCPMRFGSTDTATAFSTLGIRQVTPSRPSADRC